MSSSLPPQEPKSPAGAAATGGGFADAERQMRDALAETGFVGGRLDAPAASGQTPAMPANAMIGGNRIIQLLGVGGMGQVWLGEDPRLDRAVAIKTMRREFSADPEAAARFLREARAVARLNHTNIIQIFQAGEEAGILFFVMEFVRGESLAQKLKREGRLDPPLAAEIIGQVALGLAYASAYGVVHRDVKPANIMLDQANHVKLTDFGLAKILSTDVHITQTGTAMGSPGYMAPEIAKGEPADHRSDIYSLGITFYQMLMGELPFIAPTPVSMMLKHVQEPLPEPAALAAAGNGTLLELLKKMTAKHPANRFRDYRELIAGLKVVAQTGVFGAHFHLPSTRSIPEPASPYPTPVSDASWSAVGEGRNSPVISAGGSTAAAPSTLSRPGVGVGAGAGAGGGPSGLATAAERPPSGYSGPTVPRAAAVVQGDSSGVGASIAGRAGGERPGSKPLAASAAIAHLRLRQKERSTLLLYGVVAGGIGLLLLVLYAVFGSNSANSGSEGPSPAPAPTQVSPPGSAVTPAPTQPTAAVLSQARIEEHKTRPWPELRDEILAKLERLEVDQAQLMMRELEYVPGLPPHSGEFMRDMRGFAPALSAFRRELEASRPAPGKPVVISSLDYGVLTLVSVNDGRFEFENADKASIQLTLSKMTSQEIINLGQQLATVGNRLDSLAGYRRFLERRAEIGAMAPPVPRGGPVGGPGPGGPGRRPPGLMDAADSGPIAPQRHR